MRVRGNVVPQLLVIEPLPGKRDYVNIRMTDNVTEVVVEGDTPVTLYEYDEYQIALKYYDGIQSDIENNIYDWMITARTLEFNENASIYRDMKEALEILEVNIDEA